MDTTSTDTECPYRQRLASATWVGFDLDDTLHEFRNASSAASNSVIRTISEQYAMPTQLLQQKYAVILREKTSHAFADDRSSHDYRKEGFLALLESVEIAADDEFIQGLLVTYERSLAASLKLKDGALGLLQRLKSLGKKVVVITEGPQDAQEWTVTQLGIAPCVDYLATTNQFRSTKTTGLFSHVLKHLGVAPDDIVYIGDNLDRDIVPAVDEGILCIYLADTPTVRTGEGVFRASSLAEDEQLLQNWPVV
ncbi:HAD-like domain-containing protein [Aspergillus keveii]|uniref:HAD-like domain-containing protein n=1 Tax=Aspergillus keveii TaxID=714993 RepID=A0ABR4FTW8_9EURO